MTRDRNPITPQEGLDIYEIDVPVRDNTPITLRIYRQTANNDALPLFLYMHGGGYVTGGLETDDATCRALALEIPVVVASVMYRLAPEHKFPVGFEDSFDVVRWVSFSPLRLPPANVLCRLLRQMARANSTQTCPRDSFLVAPLQAQTSLPGSRT
jgi:acetyl esterase/lipase